MTTGVFASKVAGVTYENPDGQRRQSIIGTHVHEGMQVFPKREPDNPYDSNAIGLWIRVTVWFLPTELQIGYIGAYLAEELSQHLDRGGKLNITVLNVTGGGGDSLGANIRIDKTGKGTAQKTRSKTSNCGCGCILIVLLFALLLSVSPSMCRTAVVREEPSRAPAYTPQPSAPPRQGQPRASSSKAERIQAKEDYLGNLSLENLRTDETTSGRSSIFGTVVNGGSRTVREVRITVRFLDSGGGLIAEEDYRPALTTKYPSGDRSRPIMPGNGGGFEISVEHDVPSDWPGYFRAEITGLEFMD